MNDDVVELQTQLSFQEDIIAQLNDVVTRQQKDIDDLKFELKRIQKQLKGIMLGDAVAPSEDQPPPHY